VTDLMLAATMPGAAVLIFVSVVAWDRLREPHRNLRRPFAIGGTRDYRDACRRVERLAAAGDWRYAWSGCVAICTWLRSERHYGSARRRARLAADLDTWTARRAEFSPLAEI
jgi:hypothetical protein